MKAISLKKITGFRLAVLLTLAITVFYFFAGEQFQLFKFFELKALDMRFKIRGVRQPNPDVGIVVIDDYSIEAMGRWPWPRSYHAAVVDKLFQEGASVVGFDIIFSEPEENPVFIKLRELKYFFDRTGLERESKKGSEFADILRQAVQITDNDMLLAEAMERTNNVVSPLVFMGFGGKTTVQSTKDVDSSSYKDLMKEGESPTPSSPEKHNNDMPPAELMGGSDMPPSNLMGDELDAPDDYIPQVVRDNAFPALGPIESMTIPVATELLLPLSEYIDASVGFGFVNFFPDIDGALRWDNMALHFLGRNYPPIAIEMIRQYRGMDKSDIEILPGKGIRFGTTVIPTDNQGRMLINYYGPTRTISYYSFSDVLDGAYPEGTFKDKILLVGGAATGLGDVWFTPFTQSLPGVEKHATVISNILNEEFVSRGKNTVYIEVVFILLIGLLLGYYLPRLSSTRAMGVTVGTIILVLAGNYLIFRFANLWVNMVYPIFNIIIVSFGVIIFQYFTEEREKKKIKQAFKQYLNPALVEQLSSSHDSLKLGGEQKELTVLFSDIRSFTSISEGMTPEQLVALINTYLSLMTKVIMDEDGVVDKFIGDAIMAIYGAPVFFEDHPVKAATTAVRMMEELKRVKPEWDKAGWPDINIGIGINTGTMVVGNMGSEDRFDYTVMGDSVNLASRLEGLSKMYGAGIIISEFTASKLPGFIVKELDMVRVKGKAEPIKIFELLGKGTPDEYLSKEISVYNKALALYRQRNWTDAMNLFARLHKETGRLLYEMYRDRCRGFVKQPPPENWDGVYTLTKK